MANAKVYKATGRRKRSSAQVTLTAGKGNITVNGVDVNVIVKGGGFSGQTGAIRLGIARALLEVNSEGYRATLKGAGMITRDSRIKERKKYGLKKARRAPQFSKR